MTLHILSADLPRPSALDQRAWEAIEDALGRLRSAVASDDRPLIVGSTKELVEATARVVLESRGLPAGSDENYDTVLGNAHRAVEHQLGSGVAPDAAVRQAATFARKLAGVLRELRNTYGTGHGRSALPVIEDEVIETCVDGALLWTRWALRRLQLLLLGSLQPLIADLRTSWFTKGSLAERLAAANLPGLDPADQRQLGVAVGQRAARNTFTVRIDGVEACARSQDAVAWPLGYREGLVEGLFLDEFGQVHVDEQAYGPRLVAEVLTPHPDAAGVLASLAERISGSAWAHELIPVWRKVVAEMRLARNLLLYEEAQNSWDDIIDHLSEIGELHEAAQQ